jgi:tRNA pseudouridine-54 N-methylase
MDNSVEIVSYLEDGYEVTVDTHYWFRFSPNKDRVLVEVSFGHNGAYDEQMVRAKRRKALRALENHETAKTFFVTPGLTTAHQR